MKSGYWHLGLWLWKKSLFDLKNKINEDLFVSVLLLPLVQQSFQQEISLTTAKIEHIFHQGEALIEKSEPLDAAVIEEELEELQRYCQEVFGRVERYYKKLIRLPVRSDNKKFYSPFHCLSWLGSVPGLK